MRIGAVRLHVVDGTYEIYRAHFSKRPGHTAKNGQDVKATVGLMSSLLRLLDDAKEAVTHLAIAFDNPIRSFRNDLYPGYKSDEGVPPELRSQFDMVERAASALGVVVWSMKEYEADDALGTATVCFGDAFEQVRVLTPDKDLGQCVRGSRVVQVDRMRDRVIDEDAVFAAWGVGPRSIADLLALMGDSADGFPGVVGFGAKTSAALLARYVHLEAIPDDAAAWARDGVTVRGVERLAATLRESRADAALFKKLATLVMDVPLAEKADDVRWRGVPRALFAQICDELDLDAAWADRPKRFAD